MLTTTATTTPAGVSQGMRDDTWSGTLRKGTSQPYRWWLLTVLPTRQIRLEKLQSHAVKINYDSVFATTDNVPSRLRASISAMKEIVCDEWKKKQEK